MTHTCKRFSNWAASPTWSIALQVSLHPTLWSALLIACKYNTNCYKIEHFNVCIIKNLVFSSNRPSRSRVILEIHPSDSKKWIARGRLHINPEYNSNRWSNVADLAIVVFDSDLPDVKPLVIDGAPVNCSEKLQIWGYGRQTERENVLNELVDLFKNPKLKMANVSVPTGCQMKRISTDTIVTETERVTICHVRVTFFLFPFLKLKF